MAYLALKLNILSRLSYHTFWGLRADVMGAKTLYQEADDLHQNPEKRARLIDAQAKIMQYGGLLGFLIRAFCWVFNWHQYREDYYKLQAYYSWKIYQEGIQMLSSQEKHRSEEDGGFLVEPTAFNRSILYNVLNGVQHGAQQVGNALVSTFSWVGDGLLKRVTGKSQLKSVHFKINTTHFMVNEEMLVSLAALDIKADVGQLFSLADLKKAYHQKSLKTHPDRSGGHKTQFVAVKEAYDELLRLIKKMAAPYEFWTEIENQLATWDEQLDGVRQQLKELAEQKQQSDITFARFEQHVDEYRKDTEKYRKDTEKYRKDTEKYRKDTEKYRKDTEKYREATEEYRKETEEYRKETEEFDRQRAEDYEKASASMATLTQGIDELMAGLQELQALVDAQEEDSDNDSIRSAIEPQAANPHRIFTTSSHSLQRSNNTSPAPEDNLPKPP